MADKTPEVLSAEAAERIALASAQAQKQVEEGRDKAIDPAIASMTASELEARIKEMFSQASAAAKAPVPPVEPDWATLSELDALNVANAMYIPVIEHDVPAYMDIKLLDESYDVVWANRDQRRLGQLQAEGYEFLKKEHVAKSFKLPLKFDSEGLYVYQDTVAMRVHKRILYGKRRRIVELSMRQLKGPQQLAKSQLTEKVISHDDSLGVAFEKGSMKFF